MLRSHLYLKKYVALGSRFRGVGHEEMEQLHDDNFALGLQKD